MISKTNFEFEHCIPLYLDLNFNQKFQTKPKCELDVPKQIQFLKPDIPVQIKTLLRNPKLSPNNCKSQTESEFLRDIKDQILILSYKI